MNNPNLNFAWGDTDGVREIMIDAYREENLLVRGSWDSFNLDQGYPPPVGNPNLLTEVRKLIKNLTKKDYKHVIITQGATHGLCASLAALSPKEIFMNDRYFGYYPNIAKQFSKNVHSIPFNETMFHHQPDSVAILDSPSNPRGDILTNPQSLSASRLSVIWDSAYWSPTYVQGLGSIPIPNHDIMVGSLSKLTGINGIRLGWVATDSDLIHEQALAYVNYTMCGVSGLSQDLAYNILKTVNMEKFYSKSNQLISSNKDEISKLGLLFGNQNIPNHGMFAYWQADSDLLKKIKDLGIVFTCGSTVGGTENEIRINLGRKTHLTKSLVDKLIKL